LLTAGTLTTGPALAAPAARQDNPTPNISLTLPTFIVTFGQEGAADLIISVPPAPGGPNPTGQVAVLAGGIGAICQGTIPSGATVLDCHMPSAFLHPGQYSVWAAYGGDAHYKITDSSHNPQQLIVNRESTSTTLTVPTAPIASDDEGGTTLTFQVSAATNGPPTGSVTVTTGSTTICSGLLANGTGACAIPTGTLGPGTYPVTATYNGEDPDFATSADVKNLTIAKADTSTTLTVSAPTVTVGDEQTENFSVGHERRWHSQRVG
jgi:hypothetical protein